MKLFRFIVWPLSRLVELILDHVPELPKDLVLSLHPLLLAEHGQCPLLIRRINLVFFPQPEQKVSNGSTTTKKFTILLDCGEIVKKN